MSRWWCSFILTWRWCCLKSSNKPLSAPHRTSRSWWRLTGQTGRASCSTSLRSTSTLRPERASKRSRKTVKEERRHCSTFLSAALHSPSRQSKRCHFNPPHHRAPLCSWDAQPSRTCCFLSYFLTTAQLGHTHTQHPVHLYKFKVSVEHLIQRQIQAD